MSQEYEFDEAGRMKYHPDIHDNHGKPWMTGDQSYLIEYYEKLGPDQVALDLGRTVTTVMTKAYCLRKKGLMAKPLVRTHHPRNVGFK